MIAFTKRISLPYREKGQGIFHREDIDDAGLRKCFLHPVHKMLGFYLNPFLIVICHFPGHKGIIHTKIAGAESERNGFAGCYFQYPASLQGKKKGRM